MRHQIILPSFALAVAAVIASAAPAGAQAAAPAPAAIPGIDTVHAVTSTVSCGSNVRPEAMAEVKKAGFRSVISLRVPGEEGYDLPAAETAARDAGLRFVSIPVDPVHLTRESANRFLEVLASPETAPVFIFCRSGQRVAAMWMIKRLVQDRWTKERALAEAEALGLTRPDLKAFALGFAPAS